MSGPLQSLEGAPGSFVNVVREGGSVERCVVGAASVGGGEANFSWQITDEWTLLVGSGQPSGALLLFASYDPPSVDNTPPPPSLDYSPAGGRATNISGGPLTLRCEAVLCGTSGSFIQPSVAFCLNGVVPDITDPSEFATEGICQTIVTASTGFAFVGARTIQLDAGDSVEPAFGWGAPQESQAPTYRSLLITYEVIDS